MRILLVGSGGREHALAWKIAQSPLVEHLWAAPGNPGIAKHARCLDLTLDDADGLAGFATGHDVDLVVIGPEMPLVAGLADRLRERGLAVFGPGARAAAIEGSKAFAKDLMARHGIPTARFRTFDDPVAARRFGRELGAPCGVKTGRVAAGQGPSGVEFNWRFGDPECQVIMARMEDDLVPLLAAVARGERLPASTPWTTRGRAAVCVALASGGYPGRYATGVDISGLLEAEEVPGVHVFHAGTGRHEGRLVTAGGRVLGVTA